MKILLISMHSIHAIRWIDNLKDSGHELYWFDITGKGKIDTLKTVKQFTGWKKRKFPHIKGEYWLSKKFPDFFKRLRPFLEVTENEALDAIIREVQPDLVQSFEMQTGSYPIVKTMLQYPKLKWLYNCWGNDIFYYQNFPEHKTRLQKVLSRVNYMTADCRRDALLAERNGFDGEFLGVIPTGGGYDLSFYEQFSIPFEQRKQIVVKGYHHLFGRALNIVKALAEMPGLLTNFDVVIFGAHKAVEDYVKDNNLAFKVHDRNGLGQSEVLKLMGNSAIYIGNNISDGMPNTVLEAMLMGAFPIQSNPGGATEEIITHGENGFLIDDPENISHIKATIQQAISSIEIRRKAFRINKDIAEKHIDYAVNKRLIQALYEQISEKPCE